jgi:rhodanese-related sulfurtransferase
MVLKLFVIFYPFFYYNWNMFPRIFITFICLTLFAACKPNNTGPAAIAHPISPGMAHNLILQQQDNSNFHIIDVRTPDEFKAGHIEHAKHIDWNNASQRTQLLNLNKDHTYLVYCKTGRRSKAAVDFLKANGITRVFNLSGGLQHWNNVVGSYIPSPQNELK